MTSHLFTPLQLGPIVVPNRIAIAPMCMYTADDGSATDWHLHHWMNMAMSGAGLFVVEATAVERIGRISHGDMGLYSDANERAARRALEAARAVALPGTKIGVQLAHAGRKASSQRPWEGGGALKADQDPWPTIAPSAIPMGEAWHTPREMDEADFARVRQAFVDAALRAVRVGFDLIELHMAHGYLLHSIQSPISNRRDDRYGGDAAGRRSFPIEVARAVKAALPPHVAVAARITGSDWVEGGLVAEDAVALAGALRDLGLAYACVSSGGVAMGQKIPVGAAYQAHLAEAVKQGTGIVTRAVGMIVTPAQAEALLAEGKADMVAIGRAALDDPRWGIHAADALGAELPAVPQFARARKATWPGQALKQG
ncbi:NADH:flavin oxidoreductase/NADH oxidase [Alsobacter sp. SYSU M60028]|uniref:NADH:flavin oxidoreductase/NADH oxidase n=1 Tax=Alsobacter ponti TaxID=2962936 RepID=A0ABT1LGM4_9HYPH|nr:NADH:flavin oxidoreductase/NADH oxidase [Alsobacter ponti]MCP8940650.1 NADH:flavin oxidoreductase/NADH oxidase [Alsobacter ponti]